MSTTTYRAALDALQGAQKTSRGVSVYSLRVNRPLGRRLAAAADVLGLRPDQVTLLSGLSSLGGIVLVALAGRTVPVGLAAGALLVLGFALDSADGQLARLQGTGRPAGEWADHVLDCATKLLLHAAVAVAWYRASEQAGLLLLPLAFQTAAVLLFFGGILVEKLRRGGAPRRATSGRLRSLLLLPVDNGTVCLAFLLWGWPGVFAPVYAFLLAAHVLALAVFSRSWYRDLT